MQAQQTNGWRIHKNLTSTDLTAYAKAYLVTSGHLPLPQDQALYFFTYTDVEGQTLDAGCDYELTGDDLDAYWWSVSAHSVGFKQFENSSQRYSFNMANIIRNPDGRYKISISAKVNVGNWLPISLEAAEAHENYMMSLRLYGVDKKMIEQADLLNLPSLKKIGCAS